MTSRGPGHRLAIRNIDVENVVFLEESEDVVGRVECDLAGESIWQDSHPNRDGSDNDCPVLDVFDVLDVLVLAVFLVLALLDPAETDKVDGRMLDVSLVEEFNTLGTNVSPQIAARREGHARTSERMVSHRSFLAELVMLGGNWAKLHVTMCLWPRGRFRDIRRSPEDQLGTGTILAGETGMVTVGLELGDIVGR